MNTTFVEQQRRNWEKAKEEEARRTYHFRVAEEEKIKAEASAKELQDLVHEFLSKVTDVRHISTHHSATSITVTFG